MTTGIAVANVLAMTKAFRPYTLDQQLLLPPDMRPWLPEGDTSVRLLTLSFYPSRLLPWQLDSWETP